MFFFIVNVLCGLFGLSIHLDNQVLNQVVKKSPF